MAENEKVVDSISGKINKFNNEVANLWKNTIDDGFVKSIVDLGTGIISLVDKIGLLNIMLMTTAGILGYKGAFGAALLAVQGLFAKFIVGATASAAATAALSAALNTIAPIAIVSAISLITTAWIDHKKAVEAASEAYEELQRVLFESSGRDARINALKQALKTEEEAQKSNLKALESYNRKLSKLEKDSFSYNEVLAQKNALLEEELLRWSELNNALSSEFTFSTFRQDVEDTTVEVDKLANGEDILIRKQEELAEAIEATAEAIENATKATGKFQSDTTSLVDLYDSISDGAKISTMDMINLIQQYPKLSNEILNINSSKENGLRITELMFKSNNQILIAELIGAKEILKAELDLAEVRLSNLRLATKLGEITGVSNDVYEEQFAIVSKLRKKNSEYSKTISLIEGLTIETASAQKEYNDSLGDTTDEFEELNTQIDAYEKALSGLESEQEAIKELIDITADLIKKESELYKEKLQGRKEALALLKEEADLQKKLSGLNEDRADLESKLAKLKLDSSSNNNARILEIENELAEKKVELEDVLQDEKHNMQEQALDNEIDMVEDYLSKEGQVREDAMQRINKSFADGNNQLYDELVNFNEIYGTSIETDIVSAWESARQALSSYSSDLSSLNVESVSMSINDKMLQTQMALNSANWWLADSKEEKEALHSANEVLSKQLGGGTSDFNEGSGEWNIPDRSTSSTLSPLNTSLNLPEAMDSDFINSISPNKYSNQISNSTVNNSSNPVNLGSLITINGSVTSETLSKVNEAADRIAEAMRDTNNKRGILDIGIM